MVSCHSKIQLRTAMYRERRDLIYKILRKKRKLAFDQEKKKENTILTMKKERKHELDQEKRKKTRSLPRKKERKHELDQEFIKNNVYN